MQAPTGVGKTISTIFPAVKAVGEELADRIFYLTAKTITATVAKETFALLEKNGYRAKTIQITAKEKLCPCDEMECNPVTCPYAKGHFDRVNDAVFDLLHRCEMIERDDILSQADGIPFVRLSFVLIRLAGVIISSAITTMCLTRMFILRDFFRRG